jgi:hypothetical protein
MLRSVLTNVITLQQVKQSKDHKTNICKELKDIKTNSGRQPT